MNLRETIIACDRLREKLEGVGLSDGLIEVIEFAYAEGQNNQKQTRPEAELSTNWKN